MRTANVLLYAGLAAVIGGVASFDWRAGMVVGGTVAAAIGFLLAVKG